MHCVYSLCPLLLPSQGSFLVGMVVLWLLPWGNKANTDSCFCSNRVRHCGLVGGVWMEAIGRAFVCAICSYMCRRDGVCVCVNACVRACAHACVRAQQVLIFHEQQKLKPMSLKCQPSAASQVYLRYRRQRANEEKGTRERGTKRDKKREAMKSN